MNFTFQDILVSEILGMTMDTTVFLTFTVVVAWKVMERIRIRS